MRLCILLAASILASLSLTAHGDTAKSTAELQTLHAAWFTAFDSGDGATMDQMETPNLVLVMPDGSVWKKSEPRAKTMKKRTPDGTRELSDVTVREFGETALLTGTVTSKTATETESDSTTVVFVKNGGKWKIASAQWTPKTPPPKT
jgi:ketosteroid isomerase-like protein